MSARYLLLLVGLLVAHLAPAAKHGLLIEIGQYPPGRKGLGTNRDIYWMTQTLNRQGFSVRLLANHDARAIAIRNVLDSLVRQCRPGDKVVIHYGGHGTQLPDQPDGDEKDHLDEALVPYDAPLPTIAGYAQSTLFIRDDELGLYLDRLRRAVGPSGHVLLLLDTCYSGTVSGGQGRLRTDNIRRNPTPDSLATNTVSGWLDEPLNALRAVQESGAVVLIAGASASQDQYELLDYTNQLAGPMAFGFAEAMLTIDEQTTYKTLFAQLLTVVRREAFRQRRGTPMPTLEGNAQHRLLGGDLVLPSRLSTVKLDDQRKFRHLKGGLQGYLPGSTMTVWVTRSDGSRNDSLMGRVLEATPLESIVELIDPLPNADSVQVQTTLLRQAFQPGNSRVTLPDNLPRRTEIAEWLQALPGITLVPNEADWLIRPVGDGLALCRAGDGEPVETISLAHLTTLPSRLLAHAQADWLRDLTMFNQDMQVEASLTPAQLDAAADRVLATYTAKVRNGLPILRTDQQAVFTLRNTGKRPYYVTLIDIQPNAELSISLPNSHYPVDSLWLQPGQRRTYNILDIMPPLGLETFKILLSAQPPDLDTLLQSRGGKVTSTTPTHPLLILLGKRLQNTPNQTIGIDQAGLLTYLFWIDKPNP
ncbi:hypothetical protein GCM10028805_07130 [Spirosoma harenae]